MTDSPAEQFASALQQFEADGDVSVLVDRFSDGAELWRPELDGPRAGGAGGDGEHDAAAFWDAYRRQFDEIRTEFTHVSESGEHASLEWSSKGRLATGRDVEYRGVSLLTFGTDGQVERFATYYDTAAFLDPARADG